MSSWCFIFMLWLPQQFWKSEGVLTATIAISGWCVNIFLPDTSFSSTSANYDRDGLQGLLTISLIMCESCHCPLGMTATLTVTERRVSWLLSVFNSSMPLSVVSCTLRRVILSPYVCSWQLSECQSGWSFHMCTRVCICAAGAVKCMGLLIVFAVCMPGAKWHWSGLLRCQ